MNTKNTISYRKTLDYLNNLSAFSGKPSLKNIKFLLNSMENFQNKLNVIHITGTNGKGSTANFLQNIYISAGYKIATFTSPFITNINNSIKLNAHDISNSDFSYCFSVIKEHLDKLNIKLSHFEMLTAIALFYMYTKEVNIAIIEAGIGSPLDATNVFNKKTTVFTKIDVDHKQELGNSAIDIAKTKSKLITNNSKVIIGTNEKDIVNSIKEQALSMNCKIYTDDNYKLEHHRDYFNISSNEKHLNFKPKMIGAHQGENALTAIITVDALLDKFFVSNNDIINGINSARLPLRCELIDDILIDGAHNISGIKALESVINEYFKNRKIITVFGVLKDKEINEMLKTVKAFSNEIIFTKPVSKRAYEWKDKCFPNYKDAIDKALAKKKNKPLIVITGSLYLCEPAKNYILSKEV